MLSQQLNLGRSKESVYKESQKLPNWILKQISNTRTVIQCKSTISLNLPGYQRWLPQRLLYPHRYNKMPQNKSSSRRRNLQMDITSVLLVVTGLTLSIGNNVSQVTRMTDFIFWRTMCQVVWVEMWSWNINFLFVSKQKGIWQLEQLDNLVYFQSSGITEDACNYSLNSTGWQK